MTCRQWLLENNYPDVAELIHQALARIGTKGRKSRRNWWDTLAGGPGGRPLRREGITFPVLRVAQIRQGKAVTPNAIWRSSKEVPPEVVATDRWIKRRAPSRVKLAARKPSRSRQAKAS